ncbi:unnamed protein product [Pelagomonas calceolata]|uniref:Uncharacterized protein n=1 Tax=Pelagomonas calceolata TaxID=35677 RepID=A0A8J2SY26_9STRA|nr:unnamed protein product [Pelagomonas calceolata]
MQDSPLRHEPHAWLLQALAESHSTNGADEITPGRPGLSREAVAPPKPPDKLVVARKPQPMRKNEPEMRVVVHPADFEAYHAGGDGRLYLRLSDGAAAAADESSGWVYQVVADAGIEAGSVGMSRRTREDTGLFGIGTAPTVRPWQPSPDHALATLHFSCAPAPEHLPADDDRWFVDKRTLREFLLKSFAGVVVNKGHRETLVYTQPNMTIVLTVDKLEVAGARGESVCFGQIVATTSIEIEKAAGAGANFLVMEHNRIQKVIFKVLYYVLWPLFWLEDALKRLAAANAGGAEAAPAAAAGDGDAAAAAGGGAAAPVQPGGFVVGMVVGVLGVLLIFTLALAAIDMARYLWARVVGIGFLSPVFALIRSGLVAFAGSMPVKIFLCVLYAYGSPQLDPRHPKHAELVAKLSKNDKTAAQSHMTESTLIIDQGFILANSFVDILFTLVAVTVVMKVCKYLTPEPAWWMFV